MGVEIKYLMGLRTIKYGKMGLKNDACQLRRCRGSFRNPRGNRVPLQGTKCSQLLKFCVLGPFGAGCWLGGCGSSYKMVSWVFLNIAAVSGELPQPPWGQGTPMGHKCSHLVKDCGCGLRGRLLVGGLRKLLQMGLLGIFEYCGGAGGASATPVWNRVPLQGTNAVI
jgi:hypothetical protein